MLIELSYIISLDMPKWPTNPAERIEYNTVIQMEIQAMHLLYFTICIQEHM